MSLLKHFLKFKPNNFAASYSLLQHARQKAARTNFIIDLALASSNWGWGRGSIKFSNLTITPPRQVLSQSRILYEIYKYYTDNSDYRIYEYNTEMRKDGQHEQGFLTTTEKVLGVQ